MIFPPPPSQFLLDGTDYLPHTHPLSLHLRPASRGSSSSLWLSAWGMLHSPSHNTQASTFIIRPMCTVHRTGETLPLPGCTVFIADALTSVGVMTTHTELSKACLSICLWQDINTNSHQLLTLKSKPNGHCSKAWRGWWKTC